MAQLFFKKPFQEAIRAGTKRTTIRRWDRPMLSTDQTVFSPGLGWLTVHGVEMIELDQLQEADANADGFETVAGLREVLLSFYPDQACDGKKWFRIFFTLSREFRRAKSSKSSQ